jgi:hypothetical protein
MAANEKQDGPDAELARSRQLIQEAKESAAKADLVDPAEREAGAAPEPEPPHHQGEHGSTPSGT